MKKFFNILFLFITFTPLFAQFENFNISGNIGIGSIKGNLPSQTSFAGKIFVETEPFILPFNSFEFAVTYAQKLERIIPEDRTGRYYPFIKSFSVTGKSKQQATEKIFLEEGFGLILLNDRTYNDIDYWNYGFVINFYTGIPLTRTTQILTGFDYALTLNNTNASYFLFMVGIKYNL